MCKSNHTHITTPTYNIHYVHHDNNSGEEAQGILDVYRRARGGVTGCYDYQVHTLSVL